MSIPTSIPISQYVDALNAFCSVLGVDAAAGYFPMILEQDRIVFPAVPRQADGDENERPAGISVTGNVHPQGDPDGELSVMVTIKVDDGVLRDAPLTVTDRGREVAAAYEAGLRDGRADVNTVHTGSDVTGGGPA